MIGPMLAWAVIVMSACAGGGYLAAGNVRQGIYWLAAAALNLTMTWR